jgi:hypothetical protein
MTPERSATADPPATRSGIIQHLGAGNTMPIIDEQPIAPAPICTVQPTRYPTRGATQLGGQ